MQTVRFQSVIAAAGRPEQHLLWTEPAKDKALQKALKEERVMTIHQSAVGTKADYGTVGLGKTPQGQILIFPRSLAEFAGKRVVGVNYELYTAAPVKTPASTRRAKAKGNPARKKAARKKTARPAAKAAPKGGKPEPVRHKILQFPRPDAEIDDDAADQLAAVKRKVRQALKALEQGKQVAAYEALKGILP